MTIGFSKWEKRQKFVFYRDFFILISNNTFVELLVTHKTMYIQKELPQLYYSKIKAFWNILSKFRALKKATFWKSQIWTRFRGLEPSVKKIGSKFWFFSKNKAFSFWKLLWEFKTGQSLFRKALQVIILFSTQISPFLLEK